jgi:hypothetical protein
MNAILDNGKNDTFYANKYGFRIKLMKESLKYVHKFAFIDSKNEMSSYLNDSTKPNSKVEESIPLVFICL